jgi:hypothetical protein
MVDTLPGFQFSCNYITHTSIWLFLQKDISKLTSLSRPDHAFDFVRMWTGLIEILGKSNYRGFTQTCGFSDSGTKIVSYIKCNKRNEKVSDFQFLFIEATSQFDSSQSTMPQDVLVLRPAYIHDYMLYTYRRAANWRVSRETPRGVLLPPSPPTPEKKMG